MNVHKFFDRVNSSIAHGKVSAAQARVLLDDAKAAPAEAQLKVRAFLANSLRSHLDAFTPEAQRAFDTFINPTDGTAPLDDGLLVGADQPTSMADWSMYSEYSAALGKLFVKGPGAGDLKQGAAGDCYFDASIASLAWSHPALVRKMIAANPDGTVTVTFHQPNPDGTNTPVHITVDRALPMWAKDVGADAGKPVYDTSSTPTELWPALVEKAYAKWKGQSYDAIGHGGWPKDALGEVTGSPVTTLDTAATPPDELFNALTAALKARRPVVTYTHCDGSHADDFAATGTSDGTTNVVPAHAYSVLRAYERDGQRFVVVRNPWGMHEPGADGRNDGVFALPFSQFTRLYPSVSFTTA
jgi:hypothetical protein